MLMDLHMHSSYSDGQQPPEAMIEEAIRLGYEAMAITDHVWRTSEWVPAYAAHLEQLKTIYGRDIRLYAGIEAKVLTLAGDIDADPSFDPLVDLVLGSIHRIPKPGGFYAKADAATVPASRIAEHWLTAFGAMLDNPRVDIIAHPLSELHGFGIRGEQLPLRDIADRIARSGKIMEINVRYNDPEERVVQLAAERDVPFVVSSDSHSVADLAKHSKRVKAITGAGFRIVDIERYVRDRQRRSAPPA